MNMPVRLVNVAGVMMDKKPSYPPDQWAKLSPEDKEFMREVKSVFPNVKWESETGPDGVLVFPTTSYTPGECYWSEK